MTTDQVVEVLKDPGGGLVVPQPKPFPVIPALLVLLGGMLLLGGK